MGMMIRYDIKINGIMVHAAYSEESIETIFAPLIRTLRELHEARGRRILVMMAAPPAAGKSTLCQFLASLCPEMTVLGMDGFHRRQEVLMRERTERNGESIALVSIKGAPETFDLPGLTQAIQRAAGGEEFGWPIYDRLLHNPVENAVMVEGDILLLEGNYLLLDEPGWRELHTYADYTISIRAKEEDISERLIERKHASGASALAAREFVYFSDLPNARLCLDKMLPADLELVMNRDGTYERA